MTPTDVPPAIVRETETPDAVQDEMEWLALEAQCVRVAFPSGTYYVPQPSLTRKVATWTNTGMGVTKRHPRAYTIKGESAPLYKRAKSQTEADATLAGTSTRYNPPQLGPWPRKDWRAFIYSSRELRYHFHKKDWR